MKMLFTMLMFLAGTTYSAGKEFNLTDFSYYICAENIDIYSTPDKNSEILTTLHYGTEIKPIGTYMTFKDGWTVAKIQINGRDGYIDDHDFFRLNKGQTFEPLITKLSLKNGKSLEFKNNYCEGERHSVTNVISHEKDLGYYFVKTAAYEGGESLLIDENNGAKYRIYGGNRVFSPNKKNFLASSYDEYVDAYYLAVYSISQRKPVLIFEKRAFRIDGIEWDPKEVRWLSNDTIEYIAKTKTGQTPTLIKFNGKKWAEATYPDKNPSNTPNNKFLLVRGKVGPIEVGMPVSQVEKIYGKEFTKIVSGETDDGPYSDINIYTAKDKAGKFSLRCSFDDRDEKAINSINLYDSRYKTEKGIGTGSDYEALRKEYKVAWISQCRGRPGEAGGPCAFVEDLNMTFVFQQNIYDKLSNTTDINLFPNTMKIYRIIVAGP